MVKLSKKAISLISIASAVTIAGATVAAAMLTGTKAKNGTSSNPLNRDKNYHKYSLINQLKKSNKLSSLITLQKIDNNFIYVIDENKFKTNIKSIIQEAFQALPAFASNWNSYNIQVNYKIKDATTISIDLVWFLNNTKVKYYDQFELILSTN